MYIMDEATANIDLKTENTIQNLIHEKFKHTTVITIAHRLNTVINSDKVLVLNNGELVEYGTPEKLMSDKFSYFYKLLHERNSLKE